MKISQTGIWKTKAQDQTAGVFMKKQVLTNVALSARRKVSKLYMMAMSYTDGYIGYFDRQPHLSYQIKHSMNPCMKEN